MSRRGGARSGGRAWNSNNGQRYNNAKFNDDHDDRDRKTDNKRRVSFKPSGGRHGTKGRINELTIRAHLEEDEDMGFIQKEQFGAHKSNVRGNNIRRRNSPLPHSGGNAKRKLVAGASGWFQVTIPYGQKYDKEFILKSLLHAISPEIFIPHYYKVETSSATFFIDDIKMAECILSVDRKIQMPDGFKMIIKVRNSIPVVHVDQSLKERMKLAMVKRYKPDTKALDLTKFHSDPDLLDVFCALFRPTIMLAVIDILAENIPDLEAINLADNKIHLLDHFKCLQYKLPNLKILYFSNNRISTFNSLDALKGLPIIEMVFDGNPLKDRIKDQSHYVSELRKRFPKLVKLDGVQLPPQIGFDVTEDTNLPTPKASFLCDANGATIVCQFLEQYFIIYDSDNRQPLLDAYHENAMFSLTSTFSNQQNQRLSSYLSHNRNILRAREDNRCRHLKYGRLPVVSFLSELPLTKHDLLSFGVDLTLFTPKLIMLTVTGMFKERSTTNEPLRSFQRSLVIVPSGSGFCIRNDMLHINNVTNLQEKVAFKQPTPASSSSVASNNNNNSFGHSSNIAIPSTSQQIQTTSSLNNNNNANNNNNNNLQGNDENRKLQMVQAMSLQSNMNLEWSKKCLEETNWDFQRAGFVFSELHKQNKIPAEAFLK